MCLLYTQFSTFISLDIECTANNGIAMGGCKDITFIEPMMNQPDYWSVAADCENIRVFGGFINSIVEDQDATDTYYGTWMLAVGAANLAKFIDCKITAANLLTNNHGTGTGTGAQQTIAHGCGFTPTYDQVILSERSTGGALAYQSAAPDDTNIYVTAVNAKTYNWRVDK